MEERQSGEPSGSSGIPTDLETLQAIAMRQLDWALTVSSADDHDLVARDTEARCSLAASAIARNRLLESILVEMRLIRLKLARRVR